MKEPKKNILVKEPKWFELQNKTNLILLDGSKEVVSKGLTLELSPERWSVNSNEEEYGQEYHAAGTILALRLKFCGFDKTHWTKEITGTKMERMSRVMLSS